MLPINFVDNPEGLGNIINRIEWIDLKIFIRMKQNASEISEAFCVFNGDCHKKE